MDRRSRLPFALSAAAAWLLAVPAASQDDSIPADFSGRISYSGTHQGTISGPRPQTRSGAYTLELEIDGSALRGRYSGTGGMTAGTVSGTRSGSRCRLTDDRYGTVTEALCTRTRFSGDANVRSGGTAISIRLEARAVRLVEGKGAAGEAAGSRPSPAAGGRRRYQYSWDQTAEPIEVTDRWVGRNPRVEMEGGDFFRAIDTNLSLMEAQDSLAPGQPDRREIKWGNVIRSSRRHPSSTARPVRPVYLIPLCRGTECADPNRGATRLLAFYENSGRTSLYRYDGFYMAAHRGGLSVCSFQANGGDEIPGADCYFVDRRPTPITAANAAAQYARMSADFYAADAEYRRRHPPPAVDPRCFPYVSYPPGSTSGVLEWPCG